MAAQEAKLCQASTFKASVLGTSIKIPMGQPSHPAKFNIHGAGKYTRATAGEAQSQGQGGSEEVSVIIQSVHK